MTGSAPGNATAEQAATALQSSLGNDYLVFAREPSEDTDSQEVDLDPGQLDSVLISFETAADVSDPIVIFSGAGGGGDFETEVFLDDVTV